VREGGGAKLDQLADDLLAGTLTAEDAARRLL
jgi:hypothetical protein